MRSPGTTDRKVSKHIKATENVLPLNDLCKTRIMTNSLDSVEDELEEYLLMRLYRLIVEARRFSLRTSLRTSRHNMKLNVKHQSKTARAWRLHSTRPISALHHSNQGQLMAIRESQLWGTTDTRTVHNRKWKFCRYSVSS